MIGIRCSHSGFSVMNRVADSHPEKQGSKPARASSFFFNGSILMGLLHHQFIALSQLKSVWRNNFSGPGTIILKINFLCFNGTRKPLLIHGFSPVDARLLTVYGTAFYAIKFIKSSHFKYGIYKLREVEHPKKKLVRKRL